MVGRQQVKIAHENFIFCAGFMRGLLWKLKLAWRGGLERKVLSSERPGVLLQEGCSKVTICEKQERPQSSHKQKTTIIPLCQLLYVCTKLLHPGMRLIMDGTVRVERRRRPGDAPEKSEQKIKVVRRLSHDTLPSLQALGGQLNGCRRSTQQTPGFVLVGTLIARCTLQDFPPKLEELLIKGMHIRHLYR